MQRKWISGLLALALTLAALIVMPAPRALAACVTGTSTQFRSATTGNWNATATWECSDDGSVWEAATATPTNLHGVITIRNGHTVTISASVTIDQVTVDSGGQITIASTVTWTIADGIDADLTINGTVLNQGGTWTTAGTWIVSAGGTYIHNTASGIATPLGKATLNAGSNFVYRGSSSLIPAISMSGRIYGNLSFESTSGSWSTSSLTGGTATIIQDNFVLGSSVTFNNNTLAGLTVASNWTNSGTFNAGTGTVTFNGSAAQQITGATSFANLTLNNSSGLTLNNDVSVANQLTLTSGRLTLGANNLTLGTGASVSGTPGSSKMVVADSTGEMRKQFSATGSFTFPIGDSSGNYSPAAFTVNSAGNLGSSPYIGVRVTDSTHPNQPGGATNFISRYWSASSTLTSPNYDATFTFIAGDVTGFTTSMSGKKWDGAAPWTTLGAATATTFAGTSLTSFSDFTAFDTPLAAALSSFDATSYGDHILVTWETVSELGNVGFNLWRGVSPNAPDVQLNASLIPSQGPGSSQGFSYAWPDSANLVNNTTYYYWLEDVDIAGVVTRHGPISATYSAPTAVSLSGFAPAAALPVAWPLAAAGLTALAAAAVAWRRR